ncbi:MAG: hypothetical protein QOG20_6731 [Pseudonocardiales bacterium]|jgi:hypothetical protein|nr:hypothetical protein [Pseudonocardiales bacterium]
MRPTRGAGRALGPFWGARYTRTWVTTLAELPVLSGIYFSILGGTTAWVVLVPLAVVIAAVLWLVPLSVVTTEGIRLVLERRVVPWWYIASVLEPRPGDEEVRLELRDGRILRVPGVPPRTVPELRALHAANR